MIRRIQTIAVVLVTFLMPWFTINRFAGFSQSGNDGDDKGKGPFTSEDIKDELKSKFGENIPDAIVEDLKKAGSHLISKEYENASSIYSSFAQYPLSSGGNFDLLSGSDKLKHNLKLAKNRKLFI